MLHRTEQKRKELSHSSRPKTILITLQNNSCQQITDIIIGGFELAAIPETSLVLLPRDSVPRIDKNIKNVKIETTRNFYDLLCESDLHVTYFSTCALEAQLLGVQSICIDPDGFAKEYFSCFLIAEKFMFASNEHDVAKLFVAHFDQNKDVR